MFEPERLQTHDLEHVHMNESDAQSKPVHSHDVEKFKSAEAQPGAIDEDRVGRQDQDRELARTQGDERSSQDTDIGIPSI